MKIWDSNRYTQGNVREIIVIGGWSVLCPTLLWAEPGSGRSAKCVKFSLTERKTVPLVSSTFVPSGSTAFTSVRSKSVSSQNQPSLVMQTLEAGLYHQPYTQSRSQSQPQLLQKPELRLQSPTRAPTPPKLVSNGGGEEEPL